ncbi:MAG: major facilitator superfamily 1 [Firmicutes bacterium]|nr:major facilitator superfamily 1 [Bacillota bacterium]
MQVIDKRNTGNFIIAYLMSAFGYEFIFFVMTIYVYELSKSAFNVGIFAALTFLPRLFASTYGVVIDRYNRAKVFSIAAGVTGALVMLLPFQAATDWIYITWVLIALFLTVIMNVRTALMSEIMEQDSYLRGNSMVLILLNLAKVCAPILAGTASIKLGIHNLFYLMATFFFIVMLVSAKIKSQTPVPREANRSLKAELKEGLVYLIGQPDLKHLVTVAVLWRLLIGLQVSLFVVYVKAYLSGGDAEYGMLMTFIGIGSILGSLAGPWLVKEVGYQRMMVWGLSIHYASFVVLGFLHDYYAALAVAFFSYIVFYATLVSLHSIRDKATRSDIRGRVNGSVTAILTTPAMISMLAGGYLANTFGVEKVFIGAGVLAIIILGQLSMARSSHTQPDDLRLTDIRSKGD